jgi:hypothetical protein
MRCGAQGRFGGLGLKTTQHYGWRVLLSLGLKTKWWRFRKEPEAACGVIACHTRVSGHLDPDANIIT